MAGGLGVGAVRRSSLLLVAVGRGSGDVCYMRYCVVHDDSSGLKPNSSSRAEVDFKRFTETRDKLSCPKTKK